MVRIFRLLDALTGVIGLLLLVGGVYLLAGVGEAMVAGGVVLVLAAALDRPRG